MMKRVHVKIFGDVIGVGFRSAIYYNAKRRKLKGWVRNNRDDKTVEAVFEGEEKNVDDMVEFCKQGPPGSYVEKMEMKEETFTGMYKGFEVAKDLE